MQLAIQEAKNASEHGDYPIGAVIIGSKKVLVTASNRSKRENDPTLHAEIVAIQKVAKEYGRDKLKECVMYTTNEPCLMCLGAILYSRMKGLVFGARIKDMEKHKIKTKSNHSWRTVNLKTKQIIKNSGHNLLLVENFMRDECKALFLLLK